MNELFFRYTQVHGNNAKLKRLTFEIFELGLISMQTDL